MADLFLPANGAQFSPCERYRYTLTRHLSTWRPGAPVIAFVGLNPSTADAERNDPTVRRCIGFAEAWGFGLLYMLNVHAYRSTDPRGLAAVEDPFGSDNRRSVITVGEACDLVIAAWGAHPLAPAAERLARTIRAWPHARHLGLTSNGSPRHPLYLPKSVTPQAFEPEGGSR